MTITGLTLLLGTTSMIYAVTNLHPVDGFQHITQMVACDNGYEPASADPDHLFAHSVCILHNPANAAPNVSRCSGGDCMSAENLQNENPAQPGRHSHP
jgi:hypothetical protein